VNHIVKNIEKVDFKEDINETVAEKQRNSYLEKIERREKFLEMVKKV